MRYGLGWRRLWGSPQDRLRRRPLAIVKGKRIGARHETNGKRGGGEKKRTIGKTVGSETGRGCERCVYTIVNILMRRLLNLLRERPEGFNGPAKDVLTFNLGVFGSSSYMRGATATVIGVTQLKGRRGTGKLSTINGRIMESNGSDWLQSTPL